MKTVLKKSKKTMVSEYLKTYDIYHPQSLGCNVAEIARLAKAKGCSISKLSENPNKKFY